MSASPAGSPTPVTVTVCGTLQSPLPKVRDAGATVPSVRSDELSAMVTSAVGSVSSTIVNVVAPPASDVASPATGTTVMPATSSSVLVTATSAGSIPLKLGSALEAAAVTLV